MNNKAEEILLMMGRRNIVKFLKTFIS